MKRDLKAEAALLAEPKNRCPRAIVYRAFLNAGANGLTDEELDAATPKWMTQNTSRPRRIDLRNDGHVKDSGRARPTRSKKSATVWVLVKVKP